MENLAEKLFMLCCTKEMPTPPSFIEIPQFRKVYGGMSRDEKRDFFRAVGDYENEFAKYSSACFDQGVRFAFSLMRRLYPPEDFIE